MNADPRKTPATVSKAQVITLEPVFVPTHNPLIRKFVVRPLVFVIGGVVLLVWSILGFYLWIPLLIRTCATFSFAIVSSAVAGHDISGAERALASAMGFYTRGFTVIYQSVGRVLEERLSSPPLESQAPVSWKRTIIEFCLASVMWAVPFVIYHLVWSHKPAFDGPARSTTLTAENIEGASPRVTSQLPSKEPPISVSNGADKDQQLKGLLVGSWSRYSGRLFYFEDGRYLTHPNSGSGEMGQWQIKDGTLIHTARSGQVRSNKIVNLDARGLALDFGDGPKIYYSRDEEVGKSMASDGTSTKVDSSAQTTTTQATSTTSITLAEVKAFVTFHHEKASRGDTAGLGADYAQTVVFLDKGLLSPAQIQEDEAKDREKWPKGGERIVGEIKVVDVEPHWLATYTIDFYRENAAGGWMSGTADMRLTILPGGSRLFITTQTAKVRDLKKGKTR